MTRTKTPPTAVDRPAAMPMVVVGADLVAAFGAGAFEVLAGHLSAGTTPTPKQWDRLTAAADAAHRALMRALSRK